MSCQSLAQRLLGISLMSLIPAVFATSPVFAVAVAVICAQECDVEEPVSILIAPDGSGMRFEEARDFEGNLVDATIRVQVMGYDEHGPLGVIYQYPAEDIWLQAAEDYSHGCGTPYVTIADGPTDEEGWTTFSQAPRGGGWTRGEMRVVIGGESSSSSPYDIPALPLAFNSPDIDANGRVNLTDIAIFCADMEASDTPYRSDLVWDGVIDISDIAVFTSFVGATCP